MVRQNVTTSLPKELMKKTKEIADKRGKSLSKLLIESLKQIIKDDMRYKKVKDRQIGLLGQGYDLGTKGQIKFTREELHSR